MEKIKRMDKDGLTNRAWAIHRGRVRELVKARRRLVLAVALSGQKGKPGVVEWTLDGQKIRWRRLDSEGRKMEGRKEDRGERTLAMMFCEGMQYASTL